MGATAGLSSSVARLCTAGQASSGTRNRQNLPVTGGKNCRSRDRTTEKPKPKNPENPSDDCPETRETIAKLAGGGLRYAACMGSLRGPDKLETQGKAMLSGLFQATTIPVLEQVVCFAQARHNVLAANIANMDTRATRPATYQFRSFKRAQGGDQDRDHPSTMSPGEADFQPAVSHGGCGQGCRVGLAA